MADQDEKNTLPVSDAASGGKSDVYVIDLGGPDPDPAVLRRAVDGVLDRAGMDFRDRSVLLKPNILAPLPPEMHVTTSPAVVKAVVEAVRDRGGRPAVGDNPGGVERNSLRTAEVTGILAASSGFFRNLSEEVVELPTSCPYTDKFIISKFILEAEVIINLPVFKSHMLTTLTGAVKNCFGYIAGTNKARLHLSAFSRGRFAELLLDLYEVRVPDLHIVDALYIMDGNGPTHGRARPLGKLIAGRDGLAVDAVLTRMMGLDPMQVRFFQKVAEREQAGRRPPGRYREEDIRVLDAAGRAVEVEPVPDFLLPSTIGVSIEEQAQLLASLGSIRPVVKEDLCVMCGDCRENCPPGAITLDPYPVIDAGKCISCFCCAELCTEGAMEVPSGQAAGLFDRMFRQSGGRGEG
ncbi:MAG: DUF362 domain-containing protein [Bacillota bacterium]|jgi:uncharacterized protein (DUF362 family)/Pyruvate/2-oxoacid:ferredoxin oxidoreductase delta subunit